MRVLSIDGGGIRGLIPALVLADIERRTEQPTAKLFDLIAGTSTGGILAASLARPGTSGAPMYRAEELVELYVNEGPKIFNRSLARRVTSADGILDERYGDEGLRSALRSYLGTSRLSAALVPIVLTAYEIEGRFAFFLRSEKARGDAAYDFTLADAAWATSAAPTYFEPARITAAGRTWSLVDGGVYASNPAACAVVDVETAGAEVDVLASLGTGTAIRPVPYEKARDWGQLGWARSIIDILLSGQGETVDTQLRSRLGDRYVRLQQRLELAADDLDDASEKNLRALQQEGEKLVREQAAQIDKLCERLVA